MDYHDTRDETAARELADELIRDAVEITDELVARARELDDHLGRAGYRRLRTELDLTEPVARELRERLDAETLDLVVPLHRPTPEPAAAAGG